jgi:hypothetical protein
LIQNCQFIIQLFDYFEESRPLSSDEFQVRRLAQDRLQHELKNRAAYWKQRSKQRRIRECDTNTAFHHAHATQRHRHNFIRMVRVDGVDIVSHEGKTNALSAYFKSVIGVPGVSTPTDLSYIYDGRPTPSSSITEPFSEAETKLALLAMNMNSAPGPDGFGPAFFRAAWPTVKTQIMQFMHAFFDGAADLQRINRSYMVLIPKKAAAVDVDAFRPICLQNCTLKIVSKVLTSRLQKEIPRLIDINQTGFIKGKSISDTFIYALELVQVCHKRRKPTIVLKLDFAKAFDTVNWDGLFRVLRSRGFSDRWVSWMSSLL